MAKQVQLPRHGLMYMLVFLLLVISGASAGVIRYSDSSSASDSVYKGDVPSLLDATIDSLSEGLAHKRFTSVDLVKAYLARIAEVNGQVHAVTEINPDALSIAAKLDDERSKGRIRGPLHGIPLLIKNNIATNDEMNNTAGSYALLGAKVPRDATVVQKLRDAGAIPLGKSSVSEWAYNRSLNSSNGWSPQGGQVYSPYFQHGDPEGSSSGSGVASALGLASACLGTETDGSIVLPSSFNDIVGIKPTVGLTSRHLVIPISQHQDTVGPLARTVKDAAYVLQAIAGTDPRDNYTTAIPNGLVPDYIAACDPSALFGSRVGIPRNVIELLSNNRTGPVLAAFEEALQVMHTAGATVVDETNFTAAVEFLNSNLPGIVLNADFVVDLQSYFELLTYNPNNITSLAVLRDFTQSFPLEEYPLRDTGIWDQALANWNNTDPNFWPAYQQNLYYGGEGGLFGALERNNLDAILLPTDFSSHFAAPAGAPVVTVPLGYYPAGTPVTKNSWGLITSGPNIPFGISFLGAKFSETKLIGLAYAFEQRTKVRDKVRPYVTPTTELTDVIGKY